MANEIKSESFELLININNSDSNTIITVKQYFTFTEDFCKMFFPLFVNGYF